MGTWRKPIGAPIHWALWIPVSIFRVGACLGAIWLATANLIYWEPALEAATIFLGLAIGAHWVLDASLTLLGRVYGSRPARPAGNFNVVAAMLTTAGVTLGLINAFGSGPLVQTVRVGALSLSLTVILTLYLMGMATRDQPNGNAARMIAVVIANLALWALTYGLLCMALGFVFRN